MDPLTQLNEILTTITEEAQINSVKKAEDFGFDLNRGHISLSEAFYNLNEVRDQLADAIKKGKLSQLPLSIQQQFGKSLETIANRIVSLSTGTDEIVNLTNNIEDLYVDVYYSRINSMSDEHLGYAKKLNELKHLITEAKNLQRTLQNGLQQKQMLDDLVLIVEKKSEDVANIELESQSKNQAIQEILTKSTENQVQLNALSSEITAAEKTVKELLAEARSSETTIKTIEIDGKKFSEEISNYKGTIQAVGETSKEIIEGNKNEVNSLISNLADLEHQIKDQIQKATGFSLFTSFQTRQENINQNKKQWLIYIGVLIALAIILGAIIGFYHKTYDVAFYLKLSMSLPLIFAISFCTVQYSRERKLEEEYAFKSNISISLVPYKELIEKLSTTPEQQAQYTTFLIQSISKVFTSPTESVFGGEAQAMDPEQAMRKLTSTMEALMKPIEPVLKALNKK